MLVFVKDNWGVGGGGHEIKQFTGSYKTLYATGVVNNVL